MSLKAEICLKSQKIGDYKNLGNTSRKERCIEAEIPEGQLKGIQTAEALIRDIKDYVRNSDI